MKKQQIKALRPSPGDLRRISIKKPVEPLGITVLRNDRGALFVTGVKKHSAAYNVGLRIGDQLLEVNEVDLRNASHRTASDILKQCMNSITMLVQYNPDNMIHHHT